MENQSFHSVCLAFLTSKIAHFKGEGQCPDEQQLRSLMDDGLRRGIVKPLKRKVFGMSQAEEAFRFMASGKHIGKLLINMKQLNCSPDPEVLDNERSSTLLSTTPRVMFESHKAYVVVGGLGGMGLEVCYWMAVKGARTLIITSRTGIKNDFQKYSINRLRNQFGCCVQISTLDVSNYDDADALLRFSESFGPLGGIIHLAMVLSEGLFQNQSPESFEKCCSVKVQGTYNLDLITRASYPSLDHFICFSSIASTLGNAGQTNYGLANSFIDDLCSRRKADGLAALSIAWGLVGDVGWVADNMVDVSNLAGTVPQRINSCLNVMEKVLYSSFSNIVSLVPSDGARLPSKSGNMAEIIFNILGVKDPSTLNPEITLGDLGLDSLMAVEMKQVLEEQTGKAYSSKEIRSFKVREVNEFARKKK